MSTFRNSAWRLKRGDFSPGEVQARNVRPRVSQARLIVDLGFARNRGQVRKSG
eukprot:CAMPEP_0180141958 /NCGR_PEP_ID=MMETSP0986-20121125/15269_1 /TAXON_ID=697907 /ORGANISM="non described non described, Strain CCMP2293" /LENGTH=52 /DNA_ID=CAMNT_0022085013 /DNA_START=82 /DNA_END=236 /DNA_ORIENTATION=+